MRKSCWLHPIVLTVIMALYLCHVFRLFLSFRFIPWRFFQWRYIRIPKRSLSEQSDLTRYKSFGRKVCLCNQLSICWQPNSKQPSTSRRFVETTRIAETPQRRRRNSVHYSVRFVKKALGSRENRGAEGREVWGEVCGGGVHLPNGGVAPFQKIFFSF